MKRVDFAWLTPPFSRTLFRSLLSHDPKTLKLESSRRKVNTKTLNQSPIERPLVTSVNISENRAALPTKTKRKFTPSAARLFI